MISNEEFHNWKQSDVTQLIFKLLHKQREDIKENLILDRYENEEFVKGKAMAIQEILALTHEDIIEELNG